MSERCAFRNAAADLAPRARASSAHLSRKESQTQFGWTADSLILHTCASLACPPLQLYAQAHEQHARSGCHVTGPKRLLKTIFARADEEKDRKSYVRQAVLHSAYTS